MGEFLATVDTVVNETIGIETKKVNDISESMTSLSIVIENDLSTTNNNNKTSKNTNIYPTEGDESESSHKNT